MNSQKVRRIDDFVKAQIKARESRAARRIPPAAGPQRQSRPGGKAKRRDWAIYEVINKENL
jgi:hypothetical protein